MKTKLKLKPLSILSVVSATAFIAVAVLPITSFSAWAEPLACGALTKAIEQKLIAKGVANYELSVIAKGDVGHGDTVIGICAGGTKRILYSKKNESEPPKMVTQASREVPRETVIKTANKNSGIHQFVGTKKELTWDLWMRTKEVWGLTFSPDFAYDIQVRPEIAWGENGNYAHTTVTEIRYKN